MGRKDTEEFIVLPKEMAIIAIVILSPVYIVLFSMGYPDKGSVAALSIGVIICVVRMTWNFRKRTWYWPVVFLISVLHALAAFFAHFPQPQFSLLGFSPCFFADFFGLLFIFGFLRDRFS